MSYECIRCNKLFNKKSNYGFHVNRKYPCKVLRTIENDIHVRNSVNNDFPPNIPPMSSNMGGNHPNSPPMSTQLDKNPQLPVNLVLKHDEMLHLTTNSDHLFCANNDSNDKIKYFCVDCKKPFSSNWALKKHQINSCNKVKIKILKCDICSAVFARADGLRRHVNGRCKGSSNSEINDISDEFAKKEEEINNVNDELAQKEQEINKLLAEMRIIMNKRENCDIQNISNVTTNNSNSNNNISVNNNNIDNSIINSVNNNVNNLMMNMHLVPFGKEKISDVLTDDLCKKMFDRGFSAVPVLIEYVHCNANIPQYNNCYVSNMRDNNGLIYDGDKWVLMKICDLVEALCDAKHAYLENKYGEFKEQGMKPDVKFDRYLKEHDKESKELTKRYKSDVPMILYNNRNVALQTKQNMKKISV